MCARVRVTALGLRKALVSFKRSLGLLWVKVRVNLCHTLLELGLLFWGKWILLCVLVIFFCEFKLVHMNLYLPYIPEFYYKKGARRG